MRARYPGCARADTPYADISDEDFGRWSWQLKNRITDIDALNQVLDLTDRERDGFRATQPLFRFGCTPYYALLANRADPECPIRRQIVPSVAEATVHIGQRQDPLGEMPREVVPNLIHRYPDRVLLFATDRCPVYCRFCTRRRIVGHAEQQTPRALLSEAFEYIRAHPEVKEAIISGGDALMMGDHQIDAVLAALRSIDHLDIIRIATRMPVTCPMRVTPALVDIIRRYGPVYVMTHFNHPHEVTREAADACGRLVDAGVVVYNQSVLLRGINDDVETFRRLNRSLVHNRVTPYYIHQCDLAEGIEHFRTPIARGLDIIDGLRGHMSGLAVPQLCVDVPGGLGKVTLVPDWVVGRTAHTTTLRTYTGDVADYPEPVESPDDDAA